MSMQTEASKKYNGVPAGPQGEYLLEIENLTFGPNRGDPLVRNLSFALRSGEIAAITGPSGVGKSTCLRVIADQETRVAGRVLWSGQEISLYGRAPKIALLSQTFPLFDELTVANNVAVSQLPLIGKMSPSVAQSVQEMLDRLDLDESYLPRKPHTLSGGEAQRVAIARTLCAECPLLLLDEPFSNLDRKSKLRAVKTVMQSVRNSGAAAVVVLHDDFDALQIADIVVLLHPGEAPVVKDLRTQADFSDVSRHRGFATPGGLQATTGSRGGAFRFLATDRVVRPGGDAHEGPGVAATVTRIAVLPQGSFLRLETARKDIIWLLQATAPGERLYRLGEAVFVPEPPCT